ncbi:MAG: ribonuclease Y [Chloroflexi bacterium]|nr:ribonuclease Y [Chloroflexota bacterium]MQC26505.1 ribonuclease Y [Chloroflexota bacterium]
MENSGLILVAAGIIGAVAGYLIKNYQIQSSIRRQELEAGTIISQAKEEARELALQAKDLALELRQKAEADIERKRKELNREDDRLQKRRNELDQRTERQEQRDQELVKRQSSLDQQSKDLDERTKEIVDRLESVSTMTKEEARTVLMDEVEKEARADMARIIRQIETEAREEGEKKARKLVSLAIQRVASEHVSETTTSVVALPSDDMKGRIIGRNGRNIRSFEQAAGVDVVVDDTPEAVTISSFDSVRREVARRALEKLVLDGRIHPASIEKAVEKEAQEVEKVIVEAGEQAAYDSGVGNLHKEIIKVLGRLKFRTSYGQNQLHHAVETARIASVIASELGADVELAKAGGLLHDLGKALDHNVEGTHAAIGAELAKRYGVNPIVVNAIASHHHEAEQESVEAVIVEASDAISGARPGARRESLDQYIKRIKALEDLANSYDGVVQSYALQAGREVRIIVKPESIDDLQAARMARDIAKQIERTMQYPGQIKVTVLRETRAVEHAK